MHESEFFTAEEGVIIDWGKTSQDYCNYRQGPPVSFYQKLKAHDIGLEGQRVLDLGTGTGVIAIEVARQGAKVTGVDVSKEQIEIAKFMANWEGLNIDFEICSAEEINFSDNTFDIVIANQCWLYFDKTKLLPILSRVLRKGGKVVTSHFSWLPYEGSIALETEKLILKHNPKWSGGGYSGKLPFPPKWEYKDFLEPCCLFYYDEDISFTAKEWRGRIRASRGISASLNETQVQKFDKEHKDLLNDLELKEFKVRHRIDAEIFQIIK